VWSLALHGTAAGLETANHPNNQPPTRGEQAFIWHCSPRWLSGSPSPLSTAMSGPHPARSGPAGDLMVRAARPTLAKKPLADL